MTGLIELLGLPADLTGPQAAVACVALVCVTYVVGILLRPVFR